MAALLAALPALLAAIPATAPAAAGANGLASATAGAFNGMGLPGQAAALAPAIGATQPPQGLMGMLSGAPNALKSIGTGILNNAAPINNLMGVMNQAQQMGQPNQPPPPPAAVQPAQHQSAPPLFGGGNFHPQQVPQAGASPDMGGQGIAGMLGVNPMLLARLLGGGGM